jgi:DNA-binding response OmpR family regulator
VGGNAGISRKATTAEFLHALLRDMCNVQGVEVSASARKAWLNGDDLQLTAKEFDLLYALISNAGRVVSREQLMHDVWNTSFWTSTKTIDVHVGWLRRKLGDDARHPRLITTVRGRGLRFEVGPQAEVRSS